MIDTTRVCRSCRDLKPGHDFYAGQRQCKPCYRTAVASYKAANKDRTKATKRKYYLANSTTMSAAARARYKVHKIKIIEQTRVRARRYRKEKITFIIRRRIDRQIAKAIARGQRPKSLKVALGYDPALIVPHLESQFESWMTWKNYGSGWHIDHRRPVSSFDLPAQIRECWALSNLRPLRALDNLKKGASWSGDV